MPTETSHTRWTYRKKFVIIAKPLSAEMKTLFLFVHAWKNWLSIWFSALVLLFPPVLLFANSQHHSKLIFARIIITELFVVMTITKREGKLFCIFRGRFQLQPVNFNSFLLPSGHFVL